MQYNEIYNICQPVMDWLKEHYPHNHKIVINTNGAEMIECGKLIVADEDLIDGMLDEVFTKAQNKESSENNNGDKPDENRL